MLTSFDDTTVAVVCVSCGQQHSKAIRWFRNHTELVCKGCGCTITLQLRAGIEELDYAMRGLKRSLDARRTT